MATRKTAAKDGKPTARATAARKTAPRKTAPRKPVAPAKKQVGRLNAAQQALRDELMIARQAQGWTWEMIASEAGITARQAKRAVAERRNAAPMKLKSDPIVLVEQAFEGYQLSVGSQEAIAALALERGQLANAIGAKKAANEARDKMMALLQATGRMPEEMGTLRHLIDLRGLTEQVLSAIDQFEAAIRMGEDPQAAMDSVRDTLYDALGITDAPPEDAEVIDTPLALPEST